MTPKSRFTTIFFLAAVPLAALAADPAGTSSGTPSSSSSMSSTAGTEPAPLFDQLDANHDGFLSRDEARKSADVTARFKELDRDSDSRISLDEFKKGMQPKR